MKTFWGIIALLAVLTAGLLISGRGGDQASTGSEQPTVPDEPAIAHAQLGEVTGADPSDKPQADPQQTAPPSAPAPPADGPAKEIEASQPIVEPTPGAPSQAETRDNEQPVGSDAPGDVGDAGHEASADESRDGVLTPNAPAEIATLKPRDDEQNAAELEALVRELQQAAEGDGDETPTEQTGTPGSTADSSSAVNESSKVNEEPAPAEPKGATDASGDQPGAAVSGSSAGQPNGAAAPIGEQVKPAPKADPTKPEIVPSTFEKREDGSLLADKRFVIRGQGTKESPYVVTWDMLVSANELYDPRRNKLKLPERIKMLDGKYVKVVGYVTFPIVAEGPNEMLAMLNAWDGCCIGVPPTPYDAVEVRLAKAADAEQMLMSWGSVTGKFKVEPYLAADWLLGLYLMEDAVLKAESM